MASIANIIAARPAGPTGVYCAPLGTTLPTDATSELPSAAVGLGHASEDGLEFASERSTDDVKNWGGDTVKTLQTDFTQTFSITLMEALNVDVLKVVYGDDNVDGTGGEASVKINANTLPHKSWVFEGKDGDALVRITVPDGQVTEVGPPQLTHSGVTQYEITIKAFANADGDNAYMFTSGGAVSPGS